MLKEEMPDRYIICKFLLAAYLVVLILETPALLSRFDFVCR